MLRLTIAVVLSALIQFSWGFFFWASSPMSHAMMRDTPAESELSAILAKHLPESGTYFLPSCKDMDHNDPASCEAFDKKHSAGPLVQINFRKEGYSMTTGMPVLMGVGFGHMLVVSLLAAGLLRLALPGLQTYGARFLFVLGLGVFAALVTYGSDLVWFHYHWVFPTGQILFVTVAWLLTGVVMAAIIRPEATAQSASTQTPNVRAA